MRDIGSWPYSLGDIGTCSLTFSLRDIGSWPYSLRDIGSWTYSLRDIGVRHIHWEILVV
jgi:hypothetical protein